MSASAVAGMASQVSDQQTADETAVADSINAFAFGLYAQLQSERGGNLFVSPLSISTALAMTYAGARGDTATQMADVLHLSSLSPDAVATGYGALLSDLNSAGRAGGYALDLANAIWAQQGFDLVAPFVNLIQSDYGGALKQVDFENAPEAARQTINQWVQEETNGKIQNLLPQGAIDEYTRLVLTNAIYFKSQWANPFDSARTTNASFTLASGDQVEASTMHQTGSYRYMQRDGFQVVELPYANGRLAMDVMLPTTGTSLSSIDANLVPDKLDEWLQGLSWQRVAISLPKFQFTTQFALKQPLEALGMTDAFSNEADLSGISTAEQLKIAQVLHKAFIDIDESGTEAAAATAVVTMMGLTVAEPMPPIIFNADHPFLFLIRDTQTGSVLFMGQVMNPTEQGSDPSAPVITTHQPKVEDPGSLQTPSPAPVNPPIVPIVPVKTILTDPISPPVTTPPPINIGPHSPTTPISHAPAQPAGNSFTPNEQFIESVYQQLLGRSAESAALAGWAHQLDQGASRTSVVTAIETSTEHRQDEVQAAYQHYLGREADPAGLDFFTAQLASGATFEQVAASLIGSPEFFQLHGGGNAGLIDAMFTDVLGRVADGNAQAYFAQQLAAGATLQQVAAQIFASVEYQQSLARALYAKFLDRPADPAGVENFADELHGGTPQRQVVAQLISSDEYFADAQP